VDREIPAAAALHAEAIDGGFLSSLGPAFLARLYRRAARTPGSFVLVARDDAGAVAGFVAGTDDTAALYRAFLLHDGVGAAVAGAPHLARRWRSVLETLAYGRGAPGGAEGVRAELLAMAVREDRRGRGVGRALVEAFLAELARSGVAEARVVAGDSHGAARGLYESCGFRPVGRVELHRGQGSTVLVWP